MILPKLCIALMVVSCLGCWCQGEDQPEVRLINGDAAVGSIQFSPKSWNIREGKRQSHISPNVHIENIYVPQPTPNSDDTFGYPVYPSYGYPTNSQYYAMHKDSKILGKSSKVETTPQPPPANSQIHVSATTKKPTQEPQLNVEKDNEYAALPYHIVNLPTPLSSMLSPTGVKNPYFFIINSPYSGNHNRPKPSSSSATVEDDDSEIQSTAQSSKLMKPHPKATVPYIKVSQEPFDNLGLSVAKYLLGHPLYSANDMENIRGQNKIFIDDNKRDEEENNKDSEDQDANETEADDDYITEADELTTKDVKLPLEFLWDISRPQKKVDDRVALIYLRRTKKGRNMQLEY